jgi:hypothetical protein
MDTHSFIYRCCVEVHSTTLMIVLAVDNYCEAVDKYRLL